MFGWAWSHTCALFLQDWSVHDRLLLLVKVDVLKALMKKNIQVALWSCLCAVRS